MISQGGIYFRQLTINPAVLILSLEENKHKRKDVETAKRILLEKSIGEWFVFNEPAVKLHNSFFLLPSTISDYLFESINFQELIDSHLHKDLLVDIAEFKEYIAKEIRAWVGVGISDEYISTLSIASDIVNKSYASHYKAIKRQRDVSEAGIQIELIRFWNMLAEITSQALNRLKVTGCFEIKK